MALKTLPQKYLIMTAMFQETKSLLQGEIFVPDICRIICYFQR